jgi:hypothetical protein
MHFANRQSIMARIISSFLLRRDSLCWLNDEKTKMSF